MRARHRVVVVAASLLLLGGCATAEEWGTWRSHSAHFASGQHLIFSLQNTEGGTPRVSRNDITLASSEGWWGRPITVGQEEILER
jgi:hypothetical protein